MVKKINVSLHNKFRLEVIDSKSGELKQEAYAYNVICGATWTNGRIRMGTIDYGDGDGTPSSSDTALFHRLGSKSTTFYNETFDPDTLIGSYSVWCQLETSDAVGKDISEVGLGGLYTHAMLEDQNGNPIVIHKTDTDVIKIYATVYVHLPEYASGIPITRPNNMKWFARSFVGLNVSEPPGFNGVMNAYISFHNSCRLTDRLLPASNSDELLTYSTYDYPAPGKWYNSGWNTSQRKWIFGPFRTEVDKANAPYGFRHIAIGVAPYYYLSDYGHQWYSYLSGHYIGTCGYGQSWFDHSTLNHEPIGTGDGVTKDFKFKFMYPKNVTVTVNGANETEFTVDYAPPTTDFSHYVDFLSHRTTESMKRWAEYGANKIILYNPAHVVGLASLRTHYKGDIEASNDMINWTVIGNQPSDGALDFPLPESDSHYKYYRYGYNIQAEPYFPANSNYDGYNLHFTNPPPENSIILASYDADCIAKDVNHVFDFGFEVSISEYV